MNRYLVDVIALVGLACVTAGVALVYVPASFVVFGGLLLIYAVAVSRHEEPEVPDEPAR